ncbi:hypothetical protein CJ030_MR6G008524 [Morella rubra]|uniref:Uncharacterized protein n=1 Tax=Morella rubra TaxID=262757 RepID=A0A6A1VHE7_9ROSI|nr:hypothetical protein CJ030_MR6G008524 [Morella rubra]
MDTLKRSNVSFRRQGSSGRIWNDRLHGELGPVASRTKNRDVKFHDKENAYSPCSIPSSHSEPKRNVQICCCSALFGRRPPSPTA